MNRFKLIFALSGVVFFLSCSDPLKPVEDRKSAEELAVSKLPKEISGVSQKGPFITGSLVIIYELDSNLIQTGRSFWLRI